MQTLSRHLKKFLLILLALFFIFEAWLWDVCGAAIRRVLGWFPYAQLKLWVARRIEHYSPWLTLCVFIIPALLLLPLKFMTLWLLAHRYVMAGIGMAILAKLLGLGVSSFLFALCKPKLMELRGVRWLYRHCIYWRDRAHALVAPYTSAARAWVSKLRNLWPRSKLFEKMRRHVHSMRQAHRRNQP